MKLKKEENHTVDASVFLRRGNKMIMSGKEWRGTGKKKRGEKKKGGQLC